MSNYFKHLRYPGFDALRGTIHRIVSDFHARVLQHDCDRVSGILYPQRIKDMTTFWVAETAVG